MSEAPTKSYLVTIPGEAEPQRFDAVARVEEDGGDLMLLDAAGRVRAHFPAGAWVSYAEAPADG